MKLLDQAEHNFNACMHLYSTGSFPDWVITTAYYSAAKFVEGTLFPLEIDGDTYNTFAKFYNEFVCQKKSHLWRNGKSPKKHLELCKLVRNEIPTIYSKYRWLYNSCMNARYNQDYTATEDLASRASEYISFIKKEALKRKRKSKSKVAK